MLPQRFEFLNRIGVLPKLVSTAIQYLGIKEIPGGKSNPVILNMAESIGLKGVYTDDDTSWCAVFINFLFKITGKPAVDPKGDIYNLMRAKWLLNWGNKVEIKDMKLGDIGILDRAGGGHVFIIIGKTPNGNVIGLGGNQSNSVTFSEFDINRLLGVRTFYAIAAPESAKLYLVQSDGNISTNEA
jgi:uncharacterized protein (TIGR02594 family)